MTFKVYYIFSFKDFIEVEARIERIKKTISNEHFTYFRFEPKNHPPSHGVAWKQRAKKEIHKANLVVFFENRKSNSDHGRNIAWELGLAKKHKKKVISINIDKSNDEKNRNNQSQDVVETEDQLISYIKKNLDGYDVGKNLFNKDVDKLTEEERTLLLE